MKYPQWTNLFPGYWRMYQKMIQQQLFMETSGQHEKFFVLCPLMAAEMRIKSISDALTLFHVS